MVPVSIVVEVRRNTDGDTPSKHSIALFTLLTPFIWKLPFCISLCSKTPTHKLALVNFLHSKSLEKCCQNFENRITNKTIPNKNDLDLVFCCEREIIKK